MSPHRRQRNADLTLSFASLHRQTFFRLVKGDLILDILPNLFIYSKYLIATPDIHGPHRAADDIRSS